MAVYQTMCFSLDYCIRKFRHDN